MEFWNDQTFVDWYKKSILRERILEEASAWLLQMSASDQFLRTLGLTLSLSMKASHVAVLIYDHERNDYRIRMSYGVKRIPSSLVKMDSSNALVGEFHELKQTRIAALSESARQALKYFRAEMCFPIFVRQRFYGLLLIGPRTDGVIYEPETIHFFHTLANEIGVEMEKEDYYHKSLTDPLTGLHNRAYLTDAVEQMGTQFEKSGGRIVFALIDIDHFKQINDTYGHQAGDFVLKVVAEKIRRNIRATDPCIRYGGEEFCILFSDFVRRDGSVISSTSKEFFETIQQLAERLRKEIGEHVIIWEGHEIHVTISVGLNFVDGSVAKDWQPEKLLQEADETLYAAKQTGRNKILTRYH